MSLYTGTIIPVKIAPDKPTQVIQHAWQYQCSCGAKQTFRKGLNPKLTTENMLDAHLRAHAREDARNDSNAIPHMNPTSDVQQHDPIDEGSPQHAPSNTQTLFATLTFDPTNSTPLGTMKYHTSRWELFTDEELTLLSDALFEIVDHEPGNLYQEINQELVRRGKTKS